MAYDTTFPYLYHLYSQLPILAGSQAPARFGRSRALIHRGARVVPEENPPANWPPGPIGPAPPARDPAPPANSKTKRRGRR